MTQFIVSIEDNSLVENLKQAIKMLKGVVEVKVTHNDSALNPDTQKALQELENGDTVVCDTYEDYLKLINDAIQD